MTSKYPTLFSPVKLGAIELPNRICLAPLTRGRTEQDHNPNELMAEFYSQRASGGLLIAEATMVMEACCAFVSEPGIYSESQIEGWKKVTDAVHNKGGRIFLQIWHGGRACHPDLNNGKVPVGPSAIAITNDEVHTPDGKKPYTVPRELADDEMPDIVAGFKKAAENAKKAGFDGVEVHGANGYLLDAFLRDGANKRTEGNYGGSLENRARLMLEVLQAVCNVWGSDHVGLRLSPVNAFNSMSDSNPQATFAYICERLNSFKLAYLHVMRGDFFGSKPFDVMSVCREHYHGPIIGNMGYDADEAEQAIAGGQFDAIAFGVSYLANPDLPERIKVGAELNQADSSTFYTPGPKGYTDYPRMDE